MTSKWIGAVLIIFGCGCFGYSMESSQIGMSSHLWSPNVSDFTLTITGTREYKEAIITQGGVAVKELDPATMESKLIPRLYFAGEVLDVDAFTGGFNLQIAWSTGWAAGCSAAQVSEV